METTKTMNGTIERSRDKPVISPEEQLGRRAIAIARLQAEGSALPLDSGWGGLGAFDEPVRRSAEPGYNRGQILGGTVIYLNGISYAGESESTTVFRPDQSEAMRAFSNRPA